MSKYCDFVDAFHELDSSDQRLFINGHLDYASTESILRYLKRLGVPKAEYAHVYFCTCVPFINPLKKLNYDKRRV